MLNRNTFIALTLVSGLAAFSVNASSCGQPEETLDRLYHQAKSYAAGENYMENRSSSRIESQAALCAESPEATADREARLEVQMRAQASAYARGDSLEALELTTVKQRAMNFSLGLASE